ncbi:sensor histidine kinase [Pseudonocardia nigra]|uniref:sensor histidine kinase n=1 Tax=Pseudonocardia nigra TaxID=1921578 RepID=UPI001C5FA5D5|nr:ATP-binding protein [Pseudonocardia nigra]
MARWWLAIVAVGVVVGGEATAVGTGALLVALADAVAGATFLAAGVVAAGRPDNRRLAALAYLAGVAWFAANLADPLAYLHRPLMVHAALGYPDGRLRGVPSRVVVAAAWVSAVIAPVGAGAVVMAAVGIGVGVVGVALASRASLARRRAASVGARSAVLLGIAVAAPAVIRLVEPVSPNADAVALGYAVLVGAAGAVLLVAVLQRSGTVSGVTDTVVELADVESPRLNAMVGSLRAGREPPGGVSDPALLGVLTNAAELLNANARLHDNLAAQVEQVRLSRRRLVEAADTERRRLERRLAAGAGRHLDELDHTLTALAAVADDDASRSLADRTKREVAATRDDLVQLARGLHPRILVAGGLRTALNDLAAHAAVRTAVRAPEERFDPTVETTLWYVCAEAAANVVKHANASAMEIEIALDGTDVVATVTDDGVGGAQPGDGSGLAGLADRLDAVGGRLELAERAAGGTRVRARVPLP